jgi:hypothetical protein
VTIDVGDKNQAVPRMPSKSVSAFLSSLAKYLIMLTVEWASIEASTHVAAAGEPAKSKTPSATEQSPSNWGIRNVRRCSRELASVAKLSDRRLILLRKMARSFGAPGPRAASLLINTIRPPVLPSPNARRTEG